MALGANVQSIEALKAFRVALCKFAEAARSSLGEADADLQRHGSWLSDDRQRHWKMEIRKRAEKHQQAKLALLEKKLQTSASGGRASCVDEEKALALAQRRFEAAQAKSACTVRWIRRLEEQVFEYKGLLQACNHSLDVDVVNGLAWLDRMIESLEAYVALAPPELLPPVDELSSVSRPLGEEKKALSVTDSPARGRAGSPEEEEGTDFPGTDSSTRERKDSPEGSR